MNIHHLELFYYVARHGGISEAVRHMPYGIQQPAISAQIIQLEEFLGVPLFQRRPFALSPAGAELYEFIRPFFSNIESVADKLRGGIVQHVRVGAPENVLRDHFPAIVQHVREKFPKLTFSLRLGYQPQLETWLQNQEIDLAVTVLESKPTPGIRTQPLLKLPLILLVKKSSRIASADDLWKRDRIEEPLISLPPNEPVTKYFQEGLSRLGIDWFPKIEVSSLDLVETFVAHGYGIGLSVAVPNPKYPPGVRALVLHEFKPVELGMLWAGKPSPVTQAFLDEILSRAKILAGPAPANIRSRTS